MEIERESKRMLLMIISILEVDKYTKAEKYVGALVIGVLISFLIIDGYCYRFSKATLSSKVREWTIKHPLLPFLTGFIVGLLAGHWWWPAGELPFGF